MLSANIFPHCHPNLIPNSKKAQPYVDFIKASYDANPDKSHWEKTRDQVFQHFQINHAAGYQYQDPFEAGINFSASIISLLYGAGDIVKTIKIGSLTGWDSDNPTATWGGLLGFMIGKDGIEKAFKQSKLSESYWIHRTRRNFPDLTPNQDGEDTFSQMAERAVYIIDRVVIEEMGGGVDLAKNIWYIPDHGGQF